jgi:hypothetical protein
MGYADTRTECRGTADFVVGGAASTALERRRQMTSGLSTRRWYLARKRSDKHHHRNYAAAIPIAMTLYQSNWPSIVPFQRAAPLTTKSASRSPHSVQRNSRAHSGAYRSLASPPTGVSAGLGRHRNPGNGRSEPLPYALIRSAGRARRRERRLGF